MNKIGSYTNKRNSDNTNLSNILVAFPSELVKLSTKQFSVALFITLGLVSFTIIAGFILSSTIVNATDDSVVDEINITVPVSCTLTGTGMNSHNANIVNGTYTADIGTTTLKAFCNDNEGFAIYATGYTGNTIGETNSNKLVGTAASNNATIVTGLATSTPSPDVSNWAMKITATSDSGDTSGTNALTIDSDAEGSFGVYHTVPNSYTKVAHKNSATNMDTTTGGATLTTTYAAYISKTQPADTYSGQVIYTLVHPSDAGAPPQPQPSTAGCINYFANASDAEGTMGCQSATDGSTKTLFASNFSRTGYGFAGWSDAYDYATNPNANFYGPNEGITVPAGTTANGLSLYAVWVKSVGSLQDSSKVAQLCGSGTGSLTPATYSNEGDEDESTWSISANLNSITALTDTRDNQTYAIARLTDNNCWMIENLRLADTHQEGANTVPTALTTANTNNPLNDGDVTNPTVTLKHNYTDTNTFTNLSPTSSVAYDETTAPEGWCTDDSVVCDDQSRLRTDNTANRVSYTTTQTMSTSANLYSYGNYYNWYSATAGNGTYSKSSGNTAGDLCPAGWHLPYGGNGTGTGGGNTSTGFYYLANSMSATSGSQINSRKHRHFPNNFVYSDGVDGASLDSRGTYGNYWSSTASSSVRAYGLGFNSLSVGSGAGSVSKYFGGTIRCVAPGGV